jgi:cobalamin biosynthesis protein CobD/CbiB
MTAITSDALRNIALGGIGASILLSIVLALVIRSVVGKIISLVVMAAVALALYTQQDQLKTCAEKIESGISAPGKTAVCTFFGRDVTIQIPASID